MASATKERARSFIQVLWVPRPGDRILLRRNERYLRGIVEAEFNGMYLTSCIPGEFLRSTQLFFVPRQVDYLALLWTMHADLQIDLQMRLTPYPEELKRYTMTRRFKRPGAKRETIIHQAGSPVEILSNLLQMRVSDAAFNDYINTLVLRPVRKTLAN